MTNIFAMGGYGFYIWGAYGVVALCVAAELLSLRARRRAAAKLAATTSRTEDLR